MQMHEYRPAPEVRGPNAVVTAPTAPVTPPVTPPVVPPLAEQAREPQSKLLRLVLPLVVLGIGVLGMIDLAGADVAASAYVAVPLAIVGLGLVARAWYGHGWSLAVIGALLALALVIVTAAERVDVAGNSATWRPSSIDQLNATYTVNVGDALLDLSAVNFTGHSEAVRVNVDAGNLTIVVPPQVDVRAEVQVDVGNAVVFGERWGGIGRSTHTVTDQGSDGPGGGDLTIRATVNVGNVEVRR